jgi:hypothetical protein
MPAVDSYMPESSAAPVPSTPAQHVNNLKMNAMLVKPLMGAAGIILYNKYKFDTDLLARENLMEGAIMAVSISASNWANEKLGLIAEMQKVTGNKSYTSYLTEALVTGAFYAGLNSVQLGTTASVSSDFMTGAGVDVISSFGETYTMSKMDMDGSL